MPSNPLLTLGITESGRDPARHRLWLTVVHTVAREMGGQVLGETRQPDPGRNYYSVRIRTRDGGPLTFLLHAEGRLVAATDDVDSSSSVGRFRDVPRPDLFELAGLRPLAAVELERPLTNDQTAALHPSEQRDIAYHKPPRVGDVIFSRFD